jgi:hypothetical protein
LEWVLGRADVSQKNIHVDYYLEEDRLLVKRDGQKYSYTLR